MSATPISKPPQGASDKEKVISGLADAVASMLNSATVLLGADASDVQREVLRRTAEKIPAPDAARAGNILGTVTSIFEHSKRKKWTLGDIRTAVAARGLAATDKQISNAVAYLTRRERLIQISYGVYYNRDIGTVTVDLGETRVEPERNNFE
jgi:hypothetical protein